jgi:hypothetical protein
MSHKSHNHNSMHHPSIQVGAPQLNPLLYYTIPYTSLLLPPIRGDTLYLLYISTFCFFSILDRPSSFLPSFLPTKSDRPFFPSPQMFLNYYSQSFCFSAHGFCCVDELGYYSCSIFICLYPKKKELSYYKLKIQQH